MRAEYGGYFRIINITTRERRNNLLLLMGFLTFILLNIYFNPLKFFMNDIIGIKSPNGCPLLTFTGIPCPTCGMGRAFSCLTDGDLLGSIYRNPFFILFITIFIFVYFLLFFLTLMKKKIVIQEKAYNLWFIPVIFILLIWAVNIIFGNHH